MQVKDLMKELEKHDPYDVIILMDPQGGWINAKDVVPSYVPPNPRPDTIPSKTIAITMYEGGPFQMKPPEGPNREQLKTLGYPEEDLASAPEVYKP